MSEQQNAASPQTTRIVLSWLVVSIPLAYALVQTVISVIPLFTS